MDCWMQLAATAGRKAIWLLKLAGKSWEEADLRQTCSAVGSEPVVDSETMRRQRGTTGY